MADHLEKIGPIFISCLNLYLMAPRMAIPFLGSHSILSVKFTKMRFHFILYNLYLIKVKLCVINKAVVSMQSPVTFTISKQHSVFCFGFC